MLGSRILTPDQRLRVFVSSTMQELAAEREAVREAVSSLGLTPILFELGARPHPPQALYRSYLEQSHVFVGIYWQSYGWIAPDADVSGIEDEYLLSIGRPRLVYVKESDAREEALEQFLGRIRDEGAVSYKRFADADELAALVRDDLALLLAERFTGGPATPTTDGPARLHHLPTARGTLVGRNEELATIEQLLGDGETRLLTLTGPGGIGKTRLSVEAAHRLAPRYRDGVAFVPLESVASAKLVVPAIASALGLREVGGDLMDGLLSYLQARELLLVLDNFEHVVEAAADVSRLIADAPGLDVLVTSRQLLRLAAEHELPVPPLEAKGAATTLFVERAAAAQHTFTLGDADLEVVAEICHRLDGLPLAIELAAPRMRLLTPLQLLERLSERLALAGPRDAPARQRTLEAAIAWSYDLLDPGEQRVFERLSAFHGSFTLAAAEAVCAVPDAEFLDVFASLLDKSLVFRLSEDGGVRFAMLSMIREYALGRLQTSDSYDETLRRFADHYVAFAAQVEEATRFRITADWRRSIALEADNLRAALGWLADVGDGANLVIIARGLWPWFWMVGYLDEAKLWAERALELSELSDSDLAWALSLHGLFGFLVGDLAVAGEELEHANRLHEQTGDQRGAAMTLTASGLVLAAVEGEAPALAALERGHKAFAALGDRWGTAVALSCISRVLSLFADFVGTGETLERGLRAAEDVEDDILVVLALANLAHFHLSQDDPVAARAVINRAFALMEATGVRYGGEDIIDALARLELGEGAYEHAAELAGASEAQREGMRIMLWGPRLERHNRLLADLEAALGRPAFDAALQRGRARPLTYWTQGRTLAST